MFYSDNGPVYTMKQMIDFIEDVKKSELPKVSKRKRGESYNLFNVPCAFDIETTSYYMNKTKCAWMYIWMFGINGISIYGRTFEEYLLLMSTLQVELGIDEYNRLVCYVHNLGYEFQFIRKYFDWLEVFSIKERAPIYAVTTSGIEFRCLYMLTGTKLENVGKELVKYKCLKKVGDLDYSLIRGPKTPITEEELGYCINDIRVIMCKVQECIDSESNNIGNIPMTKTGYVRRDVRKAMMKSDKDIEFVKSLKIEPDEYLMLKDAFQGGFTHANACKSGITQYDVVSYDFTSSYPSVMLSEKFPMGNGRRVKVQSYTEFMNYLQTYCCLFTIKMTNVKLKDGMGDCPISSSKCDINGDRVIDNGRVRECDELMTTITEQDFMIYRRFYKFDYEVGDMFVYPKGYLPKPIIEKVLEYYVKKTTLKDVPGEEENYQSAKANLNSIYGMMVMAIIRAAIEYSDDNWSKKEVSSMEAIIAHLDDYYESKSRFTWFPWGVWITAYARKNLFSGIYECGAEDYIYSDTDSIKILNCKQHEDYILEYNQMITFKLQACLEHYGIDKSLVCQKTIDGDEKPLGVWDFDGHYTKFKTLGAKRYIVETDDGHIKSTIAGVGKKSGAAFLEETGDPFGEFEDGLEIPADKTGKSTHTYIDDEMDIEFTDYFGHKDRIHSKSAIHMEAASFTIGLTTDYELLLRELGFMDTNLYV